MEEPDMSVQENLDAALRADVWRTTLMTGLVTVACLGLAAMAGRVDPALPWQISKVLSAVGTALAGWATYFALHEGFESWTGKRRDEVARVTIFKWVFLLGLLCALLGNLL